MKALFHRIASLTLLISLSFSCIYSQPLRSGEPELNQVQNKLMFYSVGFGFINGAIGVLINEKKPTWKEVLVKGGLQGAAGGYLIHVGKSHIYQHAQYGKLKDYWISNGLFSLGNSIIENASVNRWGYERISIDYLFARIQFDTKNRRVGIGVNCFEFISNSIYAINHHNTYQLDIKRSLQYGVFIAHPKDPFAMKGVGGKNSIEGGIQMNTRLEKEEYNYVLTHELVHYFQDNQFQLYSSWINRKLDKYGITLNSKRESISKGKLFLYAELLGPLFHDIAAYPIADKLSRPGNYYSNFFEMEARYYSRRK